MTLHIDRDPERDPALGALLREADGDAPPVDWEVLRARIADAAELPLARAGRAHRRRSLAPFLRTLLPLAAAAGVAGAYVALRPSAADPRGERDQAMIEQMVEASLPESVDQLITGEAAHGALLDAISGS